MRTEFQETTYRGMSMTRAVGYIRVSTEKQSDKGVSLDAQQAKLRAYAELYDLELVDVVVDAAQSAKTLERPGLQKALGMLKSGQAEALIIIKLDRLTRNVADLGALLKNYFAEDKWALMSVTEQIDTRTAGGRLVLNVLTSVSQWEREVIGERTRDALRHKQAMGEYIGGRIPYGYRIDGTVLVEDAGEQAVIVEARQLRNSGLSLRAIAANLDKRGFRARNGQAFGAMQIKRMVA